MRELQEKLMVVDGPDELSREAQRNATLLFLSHLRATFASKRVIREYRFTQEAFTLLLGEIEERFNKVRLCCECYVCWCCLLHHHVTIARSVYLKACAWWTT